VKLASTLPFRADEARGVQRDWGAYTTAY
jgi:hypothetical protein